MCDCDYCGETNGGEFLTTDGFYGCVVCYYIHDAVDGIEDAPEEDA